jgi:hypothetical protein
MTVTDQRWWAPTAPGIGPDEFDLELLCPGDDPKADLGQAFLALHRVGAAACEAVATQPLADENALAFALINARQQVAPEASEIISKAVGDNVNYGNLLIRDLLDDAEATALSLWRSCIAKGVPTSVTAKRVGMVYGLPPGELYTFQKHATDPKAQLPALQEAADKALFTHVSKLIAEEAVERKVEVSKQRPRGARAERWWEGEARNAQGEWVAEETTEGDVEPAEPEARPRRAQRAQRARRAQRAERASVTERVSAQAGESVGESVGSAVTEGVGVSALFGVGGPVGELLNDLPPNPNFDPGVSNLSRVPRTPPDPTKPYLAQEHGRFIDNPLAFTMPSDEWQSFLKEAGQGEIGRTFYAGRLQEYIGLPTVFQAEGVDKTTDEHEAVVRQVANKVNKGMDPVRAHRIAYQPDFGEPELANETLRWMQEELGMSQMEAAREMVHVDFLADLKNPTHSMYAVYTPRPRGRPRDAERPVPQVTEVVAIDDEGLFGEVVQRGGKEQWQINRGLSMTTTGVFGSRNRRFWDEENRVIRNQVIVQTTDEQVSKALSPERFHQLEEEGRVAPGRERGVRARSRAPPTRARRAQRAQRAKRLVARPVGDVRSLGRRRRWRERGRAGHRSTR